MTTALRRPFFGRIACYVSLLWLAAGRAAVADAAVVAAAPAPPAVSPPASAAADLDARLFHPINGKPGRHDPSDPIFGALMPLGDRAAVAIPVGLYAWGRFGDDRSLREAGVFSAAAMAGGAIATEAIKGVVGRKRPVERFGDGGMRVVGERVADGRSFPSGHATNAFAWATVLSDLYPDGSLALYGTATAVAIGRVRLGAHYPSDVLAGAVIGYVAGRLVMNNRGFLRRRPEPIPGGITTMGVSRTFAF